MPTMLNSPGRARRATLALLAGLTAVLGACADGDGVVAPGADQPARVAVAATVAASSAAVSEVRVTTRYRLIGGSTAQLDVQTIALTETSSQQVPISLDIAECLRNPNRAPFLAGGTVGADECVVELELQLLLDGVVADVQVVGPLSLRPGQTSTVSEPVALSDIAEIRITAPPANVVAPGQPLRVQVGSTMALTAQVLNSTQQPVTGRTPRWISSAPTVATVSAAGVVTAVAPGTARIAAELGTRQTAVDIRVVPPPQVLSVVAAGFTGAGTVTSAPAGINCAISGTQSTGACTFTFPGDIQAVLTATPAPGTELVGWSGDCAGSQGQNCTVDMSQPRTAGVVFRALRALTVTAAGTGTGNVVSNNGGISCQAAVGVTAGTCSVNFVEGAVVTLTATPTGISSFGGWTGDCSAAGNSTTCTVTMSQARNVTARFNAPVTVTLSGLGAGTGSVVSTPGGISCQLAGSGLLGQCSANFPEGTQLTLTANATGSSTFQGWTGPCASSTGLTCTFTVTPGASAVGVRFEPPFPLIVTLTGSGNGQVLSTPSSIICVRSNNSNSGNCSTTFVAGAVVTLRAETGSLSTFGGWTGPCSGTGDCIVTMSEARNVGAIFTRVQVPISFILNGPGSGSLALNGQTICTLAPGQSQQLCSAQADLGSTATLTASPNNNATVQYSGVCNTLALSCQFLVGANASVALTFGPPGNVVSVTAAAGATGSGSVVTTIGGIDCSMSATVVSGSCQVIAAGGSTLFLSAFADQATSIFDGWGGACGPFGLSESCTLTPAGNVDVTARFTLGVPVSIAITGDSDGEVVLESGTRTVVCVRPSSVPATTTTCTIAVRPGESVTFSANSFYSSTFTGFSSPCSGSPNDLTCTLANVQSPFTISTAFDFNPLSAPTLKAAPRTPPPTRRRPAGE